jgi:hypothetical protein
MNAGIVIFAALFVIALLLLCVAGYWYLMPY